MMGYAMIIHIIKYYLRLDLSFRNDFIDQAQYKKFSIREIA
jgi:hypothetical protein